MAKSLSGWAIFLRDRLVPDTIRFSKHAALEAARDVANQIGLGAAQFRPMPGVLDVREVTVSLRDKPYVRSPMGAIFSAYTLVSDAFRHGGPGSMVLIPAGELELILCERQEMLCRLQATNQDVPESLEAVSRAELEARIRCMDREVKRLRAAASQPAACQLDQRGEAGDAAP